MKKTRTCKAVIQISNWHLKANYTLRGHMQCVNRLHGKSKGYSEEDNAHKVTSVFREDVNLIQKKSYFYVLPDKIKKRVLPIMTVMRDSFAQHKIFSHMLAHAQSLKLHMNHVTQQKNASIIYIAGFLSQWN